MHFLECTSSPVYSETHFVQMGMQRQDASSSHIQHHWIYPSVTKLLTMEPASMAYWLKRFCGKKVAARTVMKQ